MEGVGEKIVLAVVVVGVSAIVQAIGYLLTRKVEGKGERERVEHYSRIAILAEMLDAPRDSIVDLDKLQEQFHLVEGASEKSTELLNVESLNLVYSCYSLIATHSATAAMLGELVQDSLRKTLGDMNKATPRDRAIFEKGESILKHERRAFLEALPKAKKADDYEAFREFLEWYEQQIPNP